MATNRIAHFMLARPYKSAVRFVKGEKEWLYCVKRFNFNSPKTYALCWDEYEDGHVAYTYFTLDALKPPQVMRNIVHECAHLAFSIIEHAAFDPRDGHGEPFCHLQDWLVMEAMKYYRVRVR